MNARELAPALISRVSAKSGRAGAPGFEPGIAGPKPAALPLGYAPSLVDSRDASPPLCAHHSGHGRRPHGPTANHMTTNCHEPSTAAWPGHVSWSDQG